MSAIRRVEVPPAAKDSNDGSGRDLYADGDAQPFGGSRLRITAGQSEWASFGPAGDHDGFRSDSDAELPQVVAYRALAEPGGEPVTPTLARDPDVPLPPDDMDAAALGQRYADSLAELTGLAVGRKTTASYYTPPSLVEALLDSTLDPLLDEASNLPDRGERVRTLLGLTYCDPAQGAAAFLVAAARRIARRLAVELTGRVDPDPGVYREALWTVVAWCCYGVDLSAAAVELARLTLWAECMDPDLPLPHLGHKIRHGNAIIGATPVLLAAGIPDAAFKPIEGDDPKTVAALRRRNHQERASGQSDLFGEHPAVQVDNTALAVAVAGIAGPKEPTLDAVRTQSALDEALEPERQRLRLVADTWCAAFVQPKNPADEATWITQRTLERIAAGDGAADLKPVKAMVADLANQYRFFHWYIEFPHIFPTSGRTA